MTKTTGMRATRSDRGRVQITERDLQVIQFIADQYIVPVDLYQELLTRFGSRGVVGERAARSRAAKLEQAGLVRRHQLLGRQWLSVSPMGLKYVGRQYNRQWAPVAPMVLAHTTVVARLRLWVEDTYPDGEWTSERSIRYRLAEHHRKYGHTGARVVDGGLYLPGREPIGIEVETTAKHHTRYAGIVRDRDAEWSGGIWWFTRPGHLGFLRRVLEDAGAVDHEVLELPAEVLR
jgi:hypothetical protein